MDNPADATNIFLKHTSRILLFFTIAGYIGIGIATPKFLLTVKYYLQIFIGLYLLYRYNSWRTDFVFEELDRRVAFSAGMFIFTTTIIDEYLLAYSTKYRAELITSIRTRITNK